MIIAVLVYSFIVGASHIYLAILNFIKTTESEQDERYKNAFVTTLNVIVVIACVALFFRAAA